MVTDEEIKRQCGLIVNDMESATIFGYPAKDLILFAYACRVMNVSELDLKKVVENIQFAFDFVNKEQRKALEKALDGMGWKADAEIH